MNKRGFTLIEVMIVIAILAGLIAVGAPRLIKKEANIKKTARSLTVLVKEVRNQAKLFNVTYRIVIRIESGQESYWVEKASGPALIDKEKLKEEMEGNGKKDDDKDAPPPLFQIDKRLSKKEKVLPSNLHFAQVETINMSQPVTNGIAYIHFFPEGLMEASAIQLTDKKITWTLVFNPLTGQADIVEKAVNLKDLSR
ncbi:Tfp pilus assembly protein FimT/FimU [Bdellovibrio sp. HCB337]|uniref:pilus assembly FimT family protein n=1 Tax=Bdellovibrio sp. HCB337 TaxID=3394358 RepID=UPI0039A75D53